MPRTSPLIWLLVGLAACGAFAGSLSCEAGTDRPPEEPWWPGVDGVAGTSIGWDPTPGV